MTDRCPALWVLDAQSVFDSLSAPGPGYACVHSARSPDKSGPNEDGALIVTAGPGRWVLALADGLGGQSNGVEASRAALAAIHSCVCDGLAREQPLRDAIIDGFERANRAVMQNASGGATTLLVAEIDQDRLRTFHVGDSAALVFGGRGKLKLQTIAHSPVGYAMEAGVLDEEQAMFHDDRHYVSNVVGDAGMHLTMSSQIRLKPRDTVLLATDGLFDNLYVEEIVELARGGRLDSRMRAVAAACNTRMRNECGGLPGKPDDMTIVAYRRG